MADHQPAMRAQHRDMVGDGLGVGGADADIDEADAAPVGAHDVIGGHLEAMPDDAGRPRLGFVRRQARVDHDIAGQHDFFDGAGPQLLQAPAHELIDVAMIVRQQHPGLHRAPVGAGVMHQPAQGIIDARGVEQSDRALEAGTNVERAVGDFVADDRERGHGKEAREFGRRRAAAPQFVAAFEDIGVRDFLHADADLDLGAEFGDQRLELLEQIGAKILGLRHGRRIDAGFGEFGEGARVRRRHALGLIGHAQLRIAKMRAHLRARRNAVGAGSARPRRAATRRLRIELGEAIDGRGGRRDPFEALPSRRPADVCPRPRLPILTAWPRCRRSRRV